MRCSLFSELELQNRCGDTFADGVVLSYEWMVDQIHRELTKRFPNGYCWIPETSEFYCEKSDLDADEVEKLFIEASDAAFEFALENDPDDAWLPMDD